MRDRARFRTNSDLMTTSGVSRSRAGFMISDADQPEEITDMTSFLSFHAAAAARGDGLRPELLAFLAATVACPHSQIATGSDGMTQSGPDPASSKVAHQPADVLSFPRRARAWGKAGCSGTK